jgi:CheY-like chemotaxis protein
VDDGDENRELVRLVLEEVGLQVEEAVNGQIAVEMASTRDYAMIFMDMQMPVLDGYGATTALRQRGYKQPIVALTAHAMSGFETKVLAVGCTGYLTKPIDIDKLLAYLAETFKAKQVLIEQSAAPVSAIAVTPPVASNNVQTLSTPENTPVTSRLAGHPKLGAVARTFGLKLPGEVIKMEAALKSEAFHELSELAHWLKGAAGSVGYDLFTEPAQRLERAAKANDGALAAEMFTVVACLASRVELPIIQTATAQAVEVTPA